MHRRSRILPPAAEPVIVGGISGLSNQSANSYLYVRRKNTLSVETLDLKPGQGVYISTYQTAKEAFTVGDSLPAINELATAMKHHETLKGLSDFVCAAAAIKKSDSWEMSVLNDQE